MPWHHGGQVLAHTHSFRNAKLLPNSTSMALPAPLICLDPFFRMVHELGEQWNNRKALLKWNMFHFSYLEITSRATSLLEEKPHLETKIRCKAER